MCDTEQQPVSLRYLKTVVILENDNNLVKLLRVSKKLDDLLFKIKHILLILSHPRKETRESLSGLRMEKNGVKPRKKPAWTVNFCRPWWRRMRR